MSSGSLAGKPTYFVYFVYSQLGSLALLYNETFKGILNQDDAHIRAFDSLVLTLMHGSVKKLIVSQRLHV